MQRAGRPDGLDTTVGSLRSPSISSDVMSNSAKSLNSAMPSVSPLPAYIAAHGASSLISSEFDRTVTVTSQALDLVNEFLDQVLFNILATSRSVSLSALRTAVPSVLKPRLGKAAVRVAEEDLKEYLEDEEEADSDTTRGIRTGKHTFDVELAWKLARLRCMVYAQLGDLEEEDEEEWLEKEQLLEQVESKETHNDIQLDPAAAIFLASVIEYLGEQALFYAAQHAQKRMTMLKAQESSESVGTTPTLTPKTDEIVLEGKDMNHVGRDSPLSRLWRSWRRNTRDASSRQMSPEVTPTGGYYTPSHSRNGSQAHGIHQIAEEQKADPVPAVSPSQVPLPVGDNDINEIEVPGLAEVISDDEDDSGDAPYETTRRPISMTIMPGMFPGVPTTPPTEELDLSRPSEPVHRPYLERQRSMSSPTPIKEHFSRWATFSPVPDIPQEVPDDSEGTIKQGGAQVLTQTADQEPSAPATNFTEDRAQSPVSPSSPQSTVSPHTPKSSSPAARRGRTSPREPGSPNKRDGMVGGPVEAAIGAAGAAGAELRKDGERKKSLHERDAEPAAAPKRTVADEMLRTHEAVAPPKDATTGASITNVADFDSMYVPMQMPSTREVRSDAATSPQQKRSQHKISASQSSISMEALQRKPLPAEPIEDEVLPTSKVVPMSKTGAERIQPARVVDEQSQVARNGQRSGAINTTTFHPQYHDAESPVSPLPPSEHRPHTAGSNISHEGTDSPSTPPDALRSHPSMPPPSNSQPSLHSQHSRSSSSYSRVLNHSREPSGGFPAAYQHQSTSDTAELAHTSYTSPQNRSGRGTRSSTASSSTTKLAGKAQPPVHASVHATKLSEDIDADKKKSLEILIRSNETLHYTLTPATAMQNHQNPASSPRRSETQDMADFLRSTGPPGPDMSRSTNLAANKDTASSRSPMSKSPLQERVVPSSQGYSQYGSFPARVRNPLGEARDPRTERSTTMRDLADYARSTGPMDESQLPQPLSPRIPVTTSVRNTIVNQHKQPAVNSKPKNRIKLEARDPRPSRTADNSDLIDFIRQGPPRVAGDHRIDRKVAPFRTTMDSEDLNSLAPQVERGSSAAYSASSTHDERSTVPSINSQTALLASNRRQANGTNAVLTSRSQPLRQPVDDGMPKRTRRRVKDPYAIDDSDDDEYGPEAGIQQESNEESLIDFLRNTAPPPSSGTNPILAASGGSNKSRTPSYPTAREVSPHLTQSGSRVDKYKPTQPTHASHLDRPKVRSNYEAREGKPRRNDTSELAHYLLNSGPPPSANTDPQPLMLPQNQAYQQQIKEDGGLKRMFTKRKVK